MTFPKTFNFEGNLSWRVKVSGRDVLTSWLANYVMRCAIWYHLYNLQNLKKPHGGVLLLVKLQAEAFTFSKLCKWYQKAQSITYKLLNWSQIGVAFVVGFEQISFIVHCSIFYVF